MLNNDIPNPAIQCVPEPVHVGCNLLPKINFNITLIPSFFLPR